MGTNAAPQIVLSAWSSVPVPLSVSFAPFLPIFIFVLMPWRTKWYISAG